MSQADDLDRMGGEKFVQLTTFRRNGTPVATPVWVVAAGDGTLLVTTRAAAARSSGCGTRRPSGCAPARVEARCRTGHRS
ncbi:pyridoxamine 5'-phosphate oxidase family protein [Phycicoccus sp. HDW14]|uniref:pyridoxamine 5'-phosphate oxidase family protein n=1 Tax=Phycicoccus sp. HDW14 TaxID=2714941 RepID=UPI00197BCAF4|nr:pyridoxamine 5'-phosphate oxidase family protein [Phycicoccus sp. HDW14]